MPDTGTCTTRQIVEDLLGAGCSTLSEETLTVWTCGACAFGMDALHMDNDGDGWTCPICGWHQDVAS